MNIQIADVLNQADVASLREQLNGDAASFTSGAATAGWYAKGVKHNDQSASPIAIKAMETAQAALSSHAVFKAAARPKTFVKMLVSRYRPGMAYGSHVDDALMNGVRTDLSFTLFLSDPATYDGGELVIEGNDGDSIIKLAPGSAILYPTTSLHHVAEVTRGERLAIVGWVRSFIRSPEHRETLFDLDQAIAGLRATNGDRTITDRVFKARNNLIRMWAED